jgi:hypothetical protein
VTNATHDTSVQVDIFPDEFIPILKVINCALLMPEKFALTKKELDILYNFKSDFTNTAMNHGV